MSLRVLRSVVSYTGEKEVGAEGKDVPSPRRLNNEEAIQRRFFLKEAERVEKSIMDVIKPIQEKHMADLDAARAALKATSPKAEGESEEAYNTRIDKELEHDGSLVASALIVNAKDKELGEQKNEITVTDKTKAFVKKYFEEYGEKIGFEPMFDAAVEELQAVL